jgi:heavy metal sensor kinase
MKGFRPQNIRTRLTVWYIVVLASALLVYGASTAAVIVFQLRSQLDHRAFEDLEIIRGLLIFSSNGKLLVRNDYQAQSYPTEMRDPLVEVLTAGGTLLYRNELLGNRALGGHPQPSEMSDSYAARSVRLSDGMPVRVVSKRYTFGGYPVLIRIGFSESAMWQRFRQVVMGLLVGLPFVLVLAASGGYLLARRALGPIERMARRAQEINAERLGARLDVENPWDETGLLANAFNETLSRLEQSFDQMRRFTSDASHELRSPLTAIRGAGEMCLRKQRDSEDYQEAIGSMLEEAGRLTRLIDSLFLIARADSGQIQLELTTFSALLLVRDVATLLDVLAEEKDQHLWIEGDETVQVRADRVILRQVVMNLLDNAIKYSGLRGNISIRVIPADSHSVSITIEDSGPGIPEEHRHRIFDRFYRIDEGRSRDSGGAGLGLAIAKWGAEVHGGRLELASAATGCVFRLILPITADAA